MRDYPEHHKLYEIKVHSQAIGEFLDAMQEQGWVLCRQEKSHKEWYGDEGDELAGYFYTLSGYQPGRMSITDRLTEYFKIDTDKLETEKRQMLDGIRNMENTSLPG